MRIGRREPIGKQPNPAEGSSGAAPVQAFGAALGAVSAAFASMLCCAGPPVAVMLGLSGAGLAGSFGLLRPYFLGATVASLGAGFWLLRREERRACEPGRRCASPGARRLMRATLWTAAALAAGLATFPAWSGWLP